MKKLKIDEYKVYNKGQLFRILVFPKFEEAWAFDDFPEDDQLMLDGSPEFMQYVQSTLAALIADPYLIIYFPIKHKGCTRYGRDLTYDAILVRPELQFRCSQWYKIKANLDKQHWVGKYTIRYNKKKLNDLWEKKYANRYWRVDWDRKTERLLGDTVFLSLPESICLHYHSCISSALEYYRPSDLYGTWAAIGYIIPPKSKNERMT